MFSICIVRHDRSQQHLQPEMRKDGQFWLTTSMCGFTIETFEAVNQNIQTIMLFNTQISLYGSKQPTSVRIALMDPGTTHHFDKFYNLRLKLP